eukprot:5808175-Amphidinium_carterae.1
MAGRLVRDKRAAVICPNLSTHVLAILRIVAFMESGELAVEDHWMQWITRSALGLEQLIAVGSIRTTKLT